MSGTKEKILLLLYAGLALGFSYSSSRQFRVFCDLGKEWKRIEEGVLREKIRELYRSRLIRVKERDDGSFTYVLTDKGKEKTLTYHFQKMQIQKCAWDGKWRLVLFDIPEKLKNGRNALREKLKRLGFYELQKSVWIFPYACKDEIDFLIEFFGLRRFVRFCTVDFIDNDIHLRKFFHLL